MSSDLQQLYQQIILEHAKRRRGDGLAAAPDGVASGESHQLNPTCGDEITLRAAVDGSTVHGISWEGQGCSISMASASVLTELAAGLERDDVLHLVDEFRTLMRSRGSIEPDEEVLGDAAAFAGVARYPARVKCAMLAWVALEEALLAAN
ncbi:MULTISPECIES: Fe-S cluster assembly sulfur transfer protein SufU [Arthrobacter]|uniref:SUF system NifU family Fe-S cluster assembly protein n=1 Tax=Arthrobacter jinronghuae TaxID=2964609 RepID=A0ABT1NTL4_9MICC|nr:MULTISPECIES: SUF system NifU family Fe-S cluster assembly protein [Arthrobacter]MCQ1951070.1 SUF system NifU family Fe-S cluster assembly protein [Arthrobacter jinronghuae]MCQ1954383.1 SUF system NifU family Fe-S cluster assembly protein [Arthrobacter sp. zg-Y238]MCQ1957259.1 SUF system NifU family Fe-S cluster assembly protein [Arthrobacter jinronghuae]UWX79521.1 SUF system NifU family Fe-S cluster assembly protein [Arthrobacter jinronghuae]